MHELNYNLSAVKTDLLEISSTPKNLVFTKVNCVGWKWLAVLKIYIEETMKTDVKLKIDFHDVIRLNTTIDETLLGDT